MKLEYRMTFNSSSCGRVEQAQNHPIDIDAIGRPGVKDYQ